MERVKLASLLLLVALWAGLIAFRYLTYPEPQQVPLKFTSGQPGRRTPVSLSGAIPVVRRLPVGRPAIVSIPAPAPKNIFSPLAGRAPSDSEKSGRSLTAKRQAPQGDISPSGPTPFVYLPPPLPPPAPVPSPAELAARQGRIRQEHAVRQAKEHMAQFRFLGHLTRQGDLLAFLSNGTELYLVRPGEIVEGQIQLARMVEGAVTLKDAVSQVERTIPLATGGQGH